LASEAAGALERAVDKREDVRALLVEFTAMSLPSRSVVCGCREQTVLPPSVMTAGEKRALFWMSAAFRGCCTLAWRGASAA
jgi:hypothetical protein